MRKRVVGKIAMIRGVREKVPGGGKSEKFGHTLMITKGEISEGKLKGRKQINLHRRETRD